MNTSVQTLTVAESIFAIISGRGVVSYEAFTYNATIDVYLHAQAHITPSQLPVRLSEACNTDNAHIRQHLYTVTLQPCQ